MAVEAPPPDSGNGRPLLSSRLFRGIPEATVAQIIEPFERHGVRADTVIVREGEAGDSLFIIESGLVEVYLQNATGETTFLTRLGPGETFGEMSVLTGEPRSANVRAAAHTVVRMAGREAFLQAAATTPLLPRPAARPPGRRPPPPPPGVAVWGAWCPPGQRAG